MESCNSISRDDVIEKLKNDGDFDRLRLQIIRKLKDNEDLRNDIISIVKKSTALNRPGTQNMKPRQISDAIYEEVRSDVTSKISDGVWEIIRSGDGMKNEITETVQSVYNKLLNPNGKEDGGVSSPKHVKPVQKETGNNCLSSVLASEADETKFDNEPKEPPGFFLTDNQQNNNHEEQHKEELKLPLPGENELNKEHKEEFCLPEDAPKPEDALKPEDTDAGVPCGFSAVVEHEQPCDGSDEDPDVPPGFG